MLKKRNKGEKGQAMVEFALILPLLILLLCGIIDFGWIFGNQLTLNNAVREAARNTAINFDETKPTSDAVNQKLATDIIALRTSGLFEMAKMTVTLTPLATSRTTGDPVKVTASYPLPILTPVLSTLLGGDTEIEIKAQTEMRVE